MDAGLVSDQAIKRKSKLTAADRNTAVWEFLHDLGSAIDHAVEEVRKGMDHPGQVLIVQNDEGPILPPHTA
jgi:hypothetical protein